MLFGLFLNAAVGEDFRRGGTRYGWRLPTRFGRLISGIIGTAFLVVVWEVWRH